jgi:large subunit ribosomal protein L23
MSKPLDQERLMTVVLGPHVSEKTTIMADKHNQVVFRVRRDSNKTDIRRAVELLFNVKVEQVQVVNCRGKIKRSGNEWGRRQNWKKAYVTLAEGDDIDFMGPE